MIHIANITFPSSGAVTFTDSSEAYTATKLHLAGANSFTATGHATVSGLAAGDKVRYWLRLLIGKTTGVRRVIYSAQSESSGQIFKIPNLKDTGIIGYYYNVDVWSKDNVNIANRMLIVNDVFTLDTYSPPTLTNLSAERYSIRPSDSGGADILSADNTGEYVRFSFTLNPAVTSVSITNTWTLGVKAVSDSGVTKTKSGVYSGTAGITKSGDTSIFPSASFTFDAKEDWTFTFTVTDKIASVSYSCQVAKAASILNIESGGVAVGCFLSTGGAFDNNNLVLNSNFSKGTESWSGWGAPTTREIILENGRVWTHLVSSGALYEGWQQNPYSSGITIKAGQKYTISATVKGAKANQDFAMGVHWLDSAGIKGQSWNAVKVGLTETRMSFTAVASAGADRFNLMVGTNKAAVTDVYFTDIKLEAGEVLNPAWSQNPKDTAEVVPFNLPKRFETADDCGAILRGGIWDGRGYRIDYVNNTTLMDYPEGFEPYASMGTDYSENRIPMISRVGPIVFMEGTLRATKAGTLDFDGIKICTLPSWARPRMTVSQVCQGTSVNIFWLRVEPNGDVIFSRYRTAGTYTNYNVNTQFMFTLSWLAADAAPHAKNLILMLMLKIRQYGRLWG